MLAASAQSQRLPLSAPLLHEKHPNLALKILSRIRPMRQFSPRSYAAVDKRVSGSGDWVKASTAEIPFRWFVLCTLLISVDQTDV